MSFLLKSVPVIVILLLGSISCRRADNNGQNKIVNIPLTRQIDSLDPAISYDVISANVIYQCYETLYEYHYLKRPYTLQPLLADGMPLISNHGKTYTIKIKKNIRYHDHPTFNGKPRYVRSIDFVNQIKRLAFIPTRSTGWWLFDGKIKGINKFRSKAGQQFGKFFTTNVAGLKTPDDHTLVINLTTSYPQMMFALAMSFTSPLPREIIEFYDNNLSQNIVGTGPFIFQEWNKQLDLKLKRFLHYRKAIYPSKGDRIANDREYLTDSGKEIPFLNGIHFHIIKEAPTRWLNFLSKKIDYITLDKDNFNSVITPAGILSPKLKKKQIKLQISSSLIMWWLSFNMKDPIVGKNKNIRYAIAHAINTNRYIDVFTNNVAQKANSIYPPGIPGYNPSQQLPYKYDIEKAKKYLKQAGYPNGKGLPEIKYDVRGNSTTARQMAEFIKAELKKIGIKIKIIINTFPGFLKKSRAGQLQFWQGGWALDYPDSENILQLLITKNHSPGPNSTFYSNKKIDRLFEKLALQEDGTKKSNLMNKIETIVNNDLPWIMQYYSRNYTLQHNRLKNFRNSDLVINGLKYWKISNN